MTRSPELEVLAARDEIAVADRSVGRNQRFGMILLLCGGVVAGYLVLSAPSSDQVGNLQTDEEFKTSSFRPPSFLREEPKHDLLPAQPIVELPPPPEVPHPEAPLPTVTTVDVPPPPVSGDLAPVDEFPERFRSKLISLDQGDQATSTDTSQPDGAATVAGEDRSSRYLGAASRLSDRSAVARKIARIDAVVPEGTLIPGILETAINSDLPGQIRAITSQDVYSLDGRRLLIPTGTRLIGEYQSEITRGQKRIFVIWTRLIRDDGVTVRLNSIGSDSLGRSGLTGHVDNKFKERFGASILLSIVGGGASYLTGYGSDRATDDDDDAERAKDLARDTISKTFSDMANTVLSENLRIPPTISVAQGERIFVYVRQDLDFSAFYPDPVVEAMKEIRRERGRQ